MWHNSDWIKNIVLFFDGVALLVPEYMLDRPHHFDPSITTGLKEHGLLTILEPESFITQEAAELLTTQLTDILVSGVLDDLVNDVTEFRELSFSRLGGVVDSGLATMILDELQKRGLARTSKDGVSVPIHPKVHSLVLVLLAQILRAPGRDMGLTLHPATDRSRIHEALKDILRLPSMPSAGHVVSSDIEAVGIDLGPVPLDEVLDFRKAHGAQYRRYAEDLQKFVVHIGGVSAEEEQEDFRLRREMIRDAANDLSKTATQAWRRPLGLSLEIAGAAWQLTTGDMIGSILGLGAVVAAAGGSETPGAGAYSYLFSARAKLS